MPDKKKTEDGEDTGEETSTDKVEFSPESLSPEAQEHIRRLVQAESDRKTAAEMKKFQASQAEAARAAAMRSQQLEMTKLATEGNFEEIGRRVASQMSVQGIEEGAITRTAETIEANMVERFSKTLGAEAVEEIRGKVAAAGGAHAEFAEALAAAVSGKTRAEEIQAEVKAQMIAMGLAKREEDAGASTAAAGGKGAKLSTADEIEAAYGRGEVSTEVYSKAMEEAGKRK